MKTLKALTICSLIIYGCSSEPTSNQPTYTLDQAKQLIDQEKEELKLQQVQNNKTNDALYERNKVIRNNWDRYVNVTNDYTSPELGGIYDATVSVHNSLSNSIDQITVSVNYRKGNGSSSYNEEHIITNIPAGQTKTIDLPSKNRGYKIETEVISIKSTGLNFCYYPPYSPDMLKENGSYDDPFRCK